MRRAIVPPDITRLLARCELSRNAAVRLFAGLHGELPRQYDEFKRLRHPDDDRLFFYFDSIMDCRKLHTFTFFIDDSMSTEHLLVVDFEHESRPT